MDVATYYERYWSESGLHPQRKSNPGLTSLIAARIPLGSKLLDVGCGNASICGQCLPHGYDYLGVDVSENAVSEARAAGINARKIDDASSLPFPDGTFDAALCLEVFEHLFLPEVAATEILRVLKPGGVLIVTVPNTAYWRRRVELLLGYWNPFGDELSRKQPWRDPHIRFFTRPSLHRMLASAGFSRVSTGGHSTEYAGLFAGARGLRKLYFAAHSSLAYRLVESRFPSLFALRIHAVAFKPRAQRS